MRDQISDRCPSHHQDESDNDASHLSGHSSHSNTSDSNGSSFHTIRQSTQPPGTLLHHFPHTNTSRSSSGNAKAGHILHWLHILEGGPTKFEHTIAHNWCHPSEPLALFAIVCHKSTMVKAMHGFNTIIIQDEHHTTNGRVRFFLGNRITAANEHGWHLHNPPLCTTHNCDTLLTYYTGSPTTEHTIHNSTDMFLPLTTTGN